MGLAGVEEMTEEEIRELADKFGFSTETDNEGQLILYTGIYQESTDDDYEGTSRTDNRDT